VWVLIHSATEPLHGGPAGFEHRAFVYTDDEEFVDRAAPFVRAGLSAGEVVLVAIPQPRLALLREHLGHYADQVTFVDMAGPGRNPARIIPLWQSLLDENPKRPVRGLGEPVYPGRSSAEIEEAQLHEALLNIAFEHSGPFRLLCPYDASILSPDLSIAVNHSGVLPSEPGRHLPAENGRAWAEVAEKTFRTPLSGVPEGAERRTFGPAELSDLRAWGDAWARSSGLSEDRNDELALALQEICTNTIRFGGGHGTISRWQDGSSLICEVADTGYISDLLVGRVLAAVTREGGRGVWLANQLCDLVQIRSSGGHTQVRLQMDLG
jgi:anti-sigma regulatory factor (Ser/Thr protein kinase)